MHYIEEYVNFYKKQDVRHMYIWVFCTNPELRDIKVDKKIKEYIEHFNNEFVTIEKCPLTGFCAPRNFCKHRTKHENDWLAWLDIDEFMYSPIKDKTITDIIKLYEEKQVYAVQVNWRCFGSNGHVESPESVLESYTKCYDTTTTKGLIKIKAMEVVENLKGTNCLHVVKPLPTYNGVPVYHHTSTGKNVATHNTSVAGEGRVHPLYTNENPLHVAPEEEPWLRINHYIIKSVNCFKIKGRNVVSSQWERYSFERFHQYNNQCNKEDTTILSKI